MSVDIHIYVKRANAYLPGNAPGFTGCVVESEIPPIAALVFNSGIDAEAYSDQIVLQGAKAYIDDNRPNIVLVQL
jgi:hypothetical protein